MIRNELPLRNHIKWGEIETAVFNRWATRQSKGSRILRDSVFELIRWASQSGRQFYRVYQTSKSD